MTQTVNLVALQMTSGPDVTENLDVVATQLAQANLPANSLVVLPECFACFGTRDGHLLTVAESEGKGPIQARLKALAKEFNCYIVSGTLPIQCDNPQKFTASSLLISPEGKQLAHYQKIHLL